MNDAIKRYHQRRDKRLGLTVERDAVAEYRARRQRRLDAREPDWITVNGNHIPIDGEGRPIGGQQKALGKGSGGKEKGAEPAPGKKKLPKSQRPNARGYVGGWNPPPVKGIAPKEVHRILSTCNQIGGKNYDRARDMANAKDKPFLWTFTTHGRDHVQQVVQETNEAADAIESLPEGSLLHGAKIDRKLMLVSAWFHDTGMDGGDMDWSGDDGGKLRGAHAKCSALHILENAKEIEKLGVNPSQAAYIAFAHTKSMSGIEDLSDPAYFKKGLENLQAEVDAYNARNKGHEIEFDADSVFGGEPSEDNIKDMAAQVAAIRLGDANREANIPLTSQSGGEYEIKHQPSPDECTSMDAEKNLSRITITDDEGEHELSFNDPKMKQVKGHPISKGVVLGERNMAKIDVRVENGDLQEAFTLTNGDSVPYSTTEAILERCGELNTINGVPRTVRVKMTGVKSWDDLNPNAKRAYRKMAETIESKEKDRNNIRTGEPESYFVYGGVSGVTLEFDDGSTVELLPTSTNNRSKNRVPDNNNRGNKK